MTLPQAAALLILSFVLPDWCVWVLLIGALYRWGRLEERKLP